jgi:hypothetical protein
MNKEDKFLTGFTNLQEEIIQHISQTALKDSFFLTGGTALSVFYAAGHRIQGTQHIIHV